MFGFYLGGLQVDDRDTLFDLDGILRKWPLFEICLGMSVFIENLITCLIKIEGM